MRLCSVPAGASERQPTVVGKPSRFLLKRICSASGLQPRQLCIVGDNLNTDITWGNEYGAGTVLVMTGVTDRATLQKDGTGTRRPATVLESVADMASMFAAAAGRS